MNDEHQEYFLSWHGKRVGPWTLKRIQESLAAGAIHSMYQIHSDGAWTVLREFLEKHVTELEKVQAEDRTRADQHRLAELERALEAAEREKIARQTAPPVPPVQSEPVPPSFTKSSRASSRAAAERDDFDGFSAMPRRRRTSGLAVASFVLSLLFFVPIVNLVAWLLSIVFGHIALSSTSNDPTLGGRGLAIAGLAITYSILGLAIFGVVVGWQMAALQNF